jgi:hypothetical protein
MFCPPVCQHCHLPVSAREFFRIAGHTVWVHPRCLVQRGRQIDQNPERVSPLARSLAQAWLRGRPRARASRASRPKPHLRVIK